MEVSQPVASQASTLTDNPSSGFPAEHTGAGTVTDSGGEEFTPAYSECMVYASADGPNPAGGNVHSQDVDSVTQDAAECAAYESKPEVGAVEAGENAVNHESVEGMPAHPVGYDSVNGSAGELGSYQSSGAIENGVPSNITGALAAEQHVEDGRLNFFSEISNCKVTLVYSDSFSFCFMSQKSWSLLISLFVQDYADDLFVKISLSVTFNLCSFFFYMAVNSAEEDRLWAMVRANCLDFNAWTSLIEETEKVSEVL